MLRFGNVRSVTAVKVCSEESTNGAACSTLAVMVSYGAQLLVRVSSGSPGKYGSGSACSDVFRQSC